MSSKACIMSSTHNHPCNCCDKPQFYKCKKFQLCKYQKGKQYRYVQPTKPEPIRPVQMYKKSLKPIECNTVHKLSYLPSKLCKRPEQILPTNNLKLSYLPMNGNTVQKLSFPKWSNVDRPKPVKPNQNNLMGIGKISFDTIYKSSYSWTKIDIPKPFRPRSEMCLSEKPIDSKTINKLSFKPYNVNDLEKMRLVRHQNQLNVPNAEMELNTVNKLSYIPVKNNCKREACRPPKAYSLFGKYGPESNRMKTVFNESYQLPGYFQEVPSDEQCCCMCFCQPISDPIN